MNWFVLWLAQGFGAGRVRYAPGTFGSMLGLAWFFALVALGNLALFMTGLIFGLVAATWVCGRAEKILGQTDPGSVVADEIAAMPICFAGWLWLCVERHGSWPAAAYFFTEKTWLLTALTFGLFRLFDVWKPWPIRQSQALRGGLGVVADDVLAAFYTAVASGIVINFWLPPG